MHLYIYIWYLIIHCNFICSYIYIVSLYPLCISTHRYHIHILHLTDRVVFWGLQPRPHCPPALTCTTGRRADVYHTSLQSSSLTFRTLWLIVEEEQGKCHCGQCSYSQSWEWCEPTSRRASVYQLQDHAVWVWHAEDLCWILEFEFLTDEQLLKPRLLRLTNPLCEDFCMGKWGISSKTETQAKAADRSPWWNGQGRLSPSPLGMHFPCPFHQWLLGQSCHRSI